MAEELKFHFNDHLNAIKDAADLTELDQAMGAANEEFLKVLREGELPGRYAEQERIRVASLREQRQSLEMGYDFKKDKLQKDFAKNFPALAGAYRQQLDAIDPEITQHLAAAYNLVKRRVDIQKEWREKSQLAQALSSRGLRVGGLSGVEYNLPWGGFVKTGGEPKEIAQAQLKIWLQKLFDSGETHADLLAKPYRLGRMLTTYTTKVD